MAESSDSAGPPGRSKPAGEPPSADEQRLLDEAFGLGEGKETWVDLARRARRPADPLGSLGPYELLEELGRGGQGEVYKAVQPGTGRAVAIKRLAAGGLRIGSRAAERFSREVDAVTRLSHPNVVAVYSAEVIDGHALLVMEWIDGTTIDRWADAQWADPAAADRTKLDRVLRAFAAACDGVSHAHQRGVIHRDLKPSNIMVGPDGVPRVLDFGVAKVLEEWRASDPAAVRTTAWTATGFAGTPAYAPPEQLGGTGRSIDTRADVYALGVILFRLLSGVEAFTGRGGLADLLDAVRRGPARRPSQVRPAVGRESDWIVQKAMDVDPMRRYQSVDALAEDVRRLLDGRAVLAHPPSMVYTNWRAVRRRPWTWGAVALAVLMISLLSVIAGVQAARLGKRSADLAAALETANEQRQRAEREEKRQITLNRWLIDASMGAVADEAFVRSTDVSAIAVLSNIVEQLTPEDREDTNVDLRMRLGFLLRQARRYPEAEAQFAAAQVISDQVDHPTSERAGRIAMRRTQCFRGMERFAEGLACIDRAIERAAAGPPTIYSACLHLERMHCLNGLKRPTEEVLGCAAAFIAACDAHPSRKSERTRAREESAAIAMERSDAQRAEAWMREALDISKAVGMDANSVSRFRMALARAIASQARWEEAEPLARAASDYRLDRESAQGSRGHSFSRLHAEILHRLGRFDDAAARWEVALHRPSALTKPDQNMLARIRLRLGAARLGAGETVWGREALAHALSLGRVKRPDTDELAAVVDRVEGALRANGWMVNQRIEPALGELAWMAQSLDLVGETPVTADEGD